MEQKSWLWRRKSSEKTIIVKNKSDIGAGNEQEKATALELEISLQDLKEQLSSSRTESSAKDDLLSKQSKMAEEAIAGWEKAELEVASSKEQLDDALVQKAAAEERIISIDAALKECMQQLHDVKEEQQHIISDASMKISSEEAKVKELEQKLTDTNLRLAKLGAENSNLSRIVQAKERIIEDLSESNSQLQASFSELLARLDSSEKNNASLNYEVCLLQKELEIRNEEREFNLKSADAAYRQHLESIKKITKLEAECHRLRVMVRKRLPGPAALAKMRSEVEMLGNGTIETRRKKSNSAIEPFMGRDLVPQNYFDASSKSTAALLDRLCAIEDENKTLKESLSKKNSDLQSLRVMLARTASKLSQAEKQLVDSKGQGCLELVRSSSVSCDLPLASISEDGGNDDSIRCAESWASALIAELEHFRNGKSSMSSGRSADMSDLSLMDDFLEMEKLATVSGDKPFESPHISAEESKTYLALNETDPKPDFLEATGKELVPMDAHSDFSETNNDFQSRYISFEKYPNWLQDILRVIMQKHRVTQKSLDFILEEVSIALAKCDFSVNRKAPDALYVSDNICLKPQHTSDSDGRVLGTDVQISERSKQQFQSNLEKPLCKLIEIVEGIIQRSVSINNGQHMSYGNEGGALPTHESAPPSGYIARAFLWESSELSAVLQHFVIVCNDLLHGKADLEKFAVELTSTLDWIINCCFSLQDVSNMKETMKKHFYVGESHGENYSEVIGKSPRSEIYKIDVPGESKYKNEKSTHLLNASNGLYTLSKMKDIEFRPEDGIDGLRYKVVNLESRKEILEEKLQLANTINERLTTQLQESEETISNLQMQLANLKESKGLIEDQIDNQKLINADLGTQLTVAKVELNEARQKFSSLEVELEEKHHCCEDLEATCLELQLQLESVATKETPKYVMGQEEKQLRADWEIAAASEKLAECQETILNLGKQLKALASPQDAALFDQVISNPVATKCDHRPKLLDQMRAEDDVNFDDPKSPKTKEIICTEQKTPVAASSKNPDAGLLIGQKILTNNNADNSMKGTIQPSPVKSPGTLQGLDESKKEKAQADVGKLMLVPKRQKGGFSLLRKLLLRKKKENSKKIVLQIS